MSNLISNRDEEAFTSESSPLVRPRGAVQPEDRYDIIQYCCVCVYT